jgi:hypothetical protein
MHRRRGLERAAHGEHLLLATRKRARDLFEPFLDARKHRMDAFEVLPDAVRVDARISPHHEVLMDRHAREQPSRLGDRGDAAPDALGRGHGVDRRAFEQHRACLGPHDAEHGLHGRRFARRVAAEQADDLGDYVPKR